MKIIRVLKNPSYYAQHAITLISKKWFSLVLRTRFRIANLGVIIVKVPVNKKSCARFVAQSPTSFIRAKQLIVKEPKTIDWINSFKPDEVFWDIGANIGTFTIYAALKGIRVVSFEPLQSTFGNLLKNVEVNNLYNKIDCYNIALARRTRVDSFFISHDFPGYSGNAFGAPMDHLGETYEPRYTQNILGASMDSLINEFRLTPPNHIKIDVDGNEIDILIGGEGVLKQKTLKSLLVEVEIPSERERQIALLLKENGFHLETQEILVERENTKSVNQIFYKTEN